MSAAVEATDFTGVDRDVVGLASADAPRAGWGKSPCGGVYHRPSGVMPRVAFIATHYNLDFSEHYLADHMARSGYGFLAFNTRFCGLEGYFMLDGALADIGRGVSWLRVHGAEVVVLLGNSGGGSLMAAYQADEERPAGDLYVSIAAHPGRPEVLTNWMDPAVLDEFDPVATDPALDMFNPDNGPPYTPEFIARYRDAQVARNRRITEWAKGELQRVREAGYTDRLFTLQRTWADLRFADGAIDPSDRPTPACYLGDPAIANRTAFGIGSLNTLRTWLSMWSLDDSECSSAGHLADIRVPALVVQATMDSGVFPSDARAILDGLGSSDKQLVEMRGDHYFRGVEGTPRADVAELIAGWVDART